MPLVTLNVSTEMANAIEANPDSLRVRAVGIDGVVRLERAAKGENDPLGVNDGDLKLHLRAHKEITLSEINARYYWREAIERCVKLMRAGKLRCFCTTADHYVPTEWADAFLERNPDAREYAADTVEEFYARCDREKKQQQRAASAGAILKTIRDSRVKRGLKELTRIEKEAKR